MKKRILIVEDEADIRELVRYNLEREGFEVSEAESGEKGFKVLAKKNPDLILLDLMLPGKDGMQICRELKQDEKTRPVPVVMMTARGEESDIVAGLELGAEDYIGLIQQLQAIAKDYAIGRDIHVGDTIIGIKGRVGFEAAAPMIILKAHHLLEKHTQTKWQQFQKEQMANFYGMQLHEGNYLDAVMRDIEAFLESSQKTVNGDVFVTLHPHRFELEGVDSPNDLMNASFGSYGEMNKGWTADDAKGFIKITANAHKIYGSVNNVKK